VWDGPSSSASRERILVADDEPQILALMERLLRHSGYEVETAEDGLIALERLRHAARTEAGSYALILSDLKMPGADGLRVLEEARERCPDAMFVLVTGFATLDSAVSALRQGAYDYLTKPLDLEHLISTVRRALEHRALLLQNQRLLEFLQEKNVVLERLHREEQRKAEQLRRVNAIARQITTILDVETLVTTIVDLIGPAFDFVAPSFGLIEGEDLCFTGGRLDRQRMPVAESVFWQLTYGGRKPFVRTASSDRPLVDAYYDLIFPLQAGEQTVGFWVANWSGEAEFREEDLPYLESLAAQTVAVLENARLYALARQADELAFLNTVGRAANQSLDPEETIHSVLTCVQAAFNASLVEICLLNDQSEIEHVFSLVQSGGPGRARSPHPRVVQQSSDVFHPPGPLLGSEFVRRVGERPLLVRERAEVERLCGTRVDAYVASGDQMPASDARPQNVEPLCSLLGVSLHSGERHIGVLGMASVEPDAYDPEDGRLLQVVGGQVATAIENARLFREVESGRHVILQSRNTLRALVDGILEGICIVDRDNKLLAINRTQAGWAGQRIVELVGQSAERAFPSSQCSVGLIKETFQTGQPMSRTERQCTMDGQWTEWEIHTYPIASSQRSQGTPAEGEGRLADRVVVVVRDVTEQRMLEASLLHSEKLAALGTLAAGIAHEINNPMTVVSANAQILREEISSTHPYYSSITLIDRASERASKIVRNLLNLSRSEEFEFMPTDLNTLIGEAISLVEPQLRKTNIQIIAELDPDLPPIWASPHHLHVVWLNLLLNARDAIAEAGRAGRIRVVSRRREDWVVVHVSDNGIGIPNEQIKRIYDPFFTTKGPGKGTGLGLFTCYRTVMRHSGKIDVDSRVGEGTTFHISLPVRQESASGT